MTTVIKNQLGIGNDTFLYGSENPSQTVMSTYLVSNLKKDGILKEVKKIEDELSSKRSQVYYSFELFRQENDTDFCYRVHNKDVIYYLKLNIFHDSNVASIIVCYEAKDKEFIFSEILPRITKHQKEEDKEITMTLIVKNGSYYDTKECKISGANLKEFYKNYPDDFPHEEIKKCFDKNKGIVLFHGEPGTGKTTYIKALATILNEKRQLVYLPANLVDDLTNPEMISTLSDISGGILVIEDAERAIKKRSKDENSIVTTILNISDGILSDMFNLQILATFNTELKNVDEAILRKGRLLGKFEFKKLTASQAAKLSNGKVKKAATLGEIYG